MTTCKTRITLDKFSKAIKCFRSSVVLYHYLIFGVFKIEIKLYININIKGSNYTIIIMTYAVHTINFGQTSEKVINVLTSTQFLKI